MLWDKWIRFDIIKRPFYFWLKILGLIINYFGTADYFLDVVVPTFFLIYDYMSILFVDLSFAYSTAVK